MTLQICARGPVDGPQAGVAALREEFAANHCVKVAGLIDPALLQRIHSLIAAATFVHRAHGTISTELCMERNACLGLLHFLVNDRPVLRAIERMTGSQPLTAFVGRVYRLLPDAGHYDSWHADLGAGHQVGMSVNLGLEPFHGGVFEIRRRNATAPHAAIANTGAGDAILFAIDDDLQHRNTPLEGCVAKTAFAGWFLVPQPAR